MLEKGRLMGPREIRYTYIFEDGDRTDFWFRFAPESFELIGLPEQAPDWAALEFHQCENCPLTTEDQSYCPLARALAEPVLRFSDVLSYTPLRVEVQTTERTVGIEGSAQDGISPLLGLLSAASGCPHTAPFRPMARFHLPFANESETMYRAVSMYLLGQYFRTKAGKAPDLRLDGLVRIYSDLEIVNRAMARRLREASKEDSTLNGIVLLDVFAKALPIAMDETLDGLSNLYSAYL